MVNNVLSNMKDDPRFKYLMWFMGILVTAWTATTGYQINMLDSISERLTRLETIIQYSDEKIKSLDGRVTTIEANVRFLETEVQQIKHEDK